MIDKDILPLGVIMIGIAEGTAGDGGIAVTIGTTSLTEEILEDALGITDIDGFTELLARCSLKIKEDIAEYFIDETQDKVERVFS